MLLGAHEPQMIGPPALHEAQVVGVIDDPGKDRVDGIATGPCGRQGLDITGSLEVRGGLNPEQISRSDFVLPP